MKRSTMITNVHSKMYVSDDIVEKLVDCQVDETDFNPFFKKYRKTKYKSTQGFVEGIVELTFISQDYNNVKRVSIPVQGCFLYTAVKGRFGFIKTIWSTSLS